MTAEETQIDRLALVPDAPATSAGEPSGYVQITLTTEGRIALRGSRQMLEWLLRELTEEGWKLELDDLRWCG
jgi:hypothetical protein